MYYVQLGSLLDTVRSNTSVVVFNELGNVITRDAMHTLINPTSCYLWQVIHVSVSWDDSYGGSYLHVVIKEVS